jgi:hypothetical protein
MKIFYLFLIAILIVGCGPSAEQMTATADSARALTQTAAPTLTPTRTPTPTASPTNTPSPTPTIPQVQGRIDVVFVPYTEDSIIPKPPYEISMTLAKGSSEFTIQADTSDGSFSTHLPAGTYTLMSVIVRNSESGPDGYNLSTDEPKIVVPDEPCVNIGGIELISIRLPPVDQVRQFLTFQYLIQQGYPITGLQMNESGGFLLPTGTFIRGAGVCPNLPNAPEGFDWKHLPESSLAVLAPVEWNFLSEPRETTNNYFISQENIPTEGSFKTGLTIQVINDEKQDAVSTAKALPTKTMKLAGVEPVEVSERVEGNLIIYEFEYKISGAYVSTAHNMVIANKATNTLYIIVFESPAEDWEEAWVIGQAMLDQLLFLNNE